MDTIAALNFGLVISATLGTFGLTEKKDKMRYTILAGVLAGTILAVVYAMLSYMGMCSSGVYPVQENGGKSPIGRGCISSRFSRSSCAIWG